MREARTCYDHLAGRLAVAMADRLVDRGFVELSPDGGAVTASGRAFFGTIGVELDAAAARATGRRLFCRPCLDWSERRPHLAGQLGTRLCSHCLDQGWLVRRSGTRSLAVTPKGTLALRGILGHEAWRKVVDGERA